MQLSIRTYLILCSILFLLVLPFNIYAQHFYPAKEGERIRFSAMIETPNAYISGICIIINDTTEIKGSLFNEFGISAIDFSYSPPKDKVKLHHVMGIIDKWYIRKVLKKDLRALIHNLQKGNGFYQNKRNRITYSFLPVDLDNNYNTYDITE